MKYNWLDEYFDLPLHIENIDQRILVYASASSTLTTERIFNKILNLMLEKNRLLIKFDKHKELFESMKDKQAILLRYIDNKTVPEISAIIGKSERTVDRYFEKIYRIYDCKEDNNVNSKT